MTEAILMIVAMATLCFMMTCLLLIFMMYKRKDEKEDTHILSDDEKDRMKKREAEIEKDRETFEKMMSCADDASWRGGVSL